MSETKDKLIAEGYDNKFEREPTDIEKALVGKNITRVTTGESTICLHYEDGDHAVLQITEDSFWGYDFEFVSDKTLGIDDLLTLEIISKQKHMELQEAHDKKRIEETINRDHEEFNRLVKKYPHWSK